ncbi:CDGSH iron-sulfur domain-containing protein [Leptolyngbya cf. ectocarpi LEGE 11479]|uniref:CDGSH iron-sulfur domain-containing protein n=1 Tax=Leptolyngbya cf. ectocarpi LEGE 11479 TaxID=1828722 RepID=A0A928ZZM4_LEPEC|nr:CDGSH iron-sulfur domain-containing protein [Leptolyngbya ectocarpi]MBE9070377.1 CDGSH iron-sulfur domain-containing protein [Leptolyngbya cf. ectocarpi LEGE 11479]
MSEPTVADTKPAVMELEAGDYWWCSCGNSANQPFCDGAHKGTDFTPVKFTIEEKKTVALCLCKKTGKQPFCDGTHSNI